MVAEHLTEQADQLRAQQAYWEGVRRQANAQLEERESKQLQEADPNRGMYTDNERELLKSQMAGALFRLQEIAGALERIKEAQEREAAQPEQRIDQEPLADS